MMEFVSSGIPRLDTVLGGGLVRGSTIFLAGGPGAGKTTLAQQISFALGTSEHKALYYTMASEPNGKLADHLDQFAFFDRSALGDRIDLLSLAGLLDDIRLGDDAKDRWNDALDIVRDEIVIACIKLKPAVVVIDSARALREAAPAENFREFVYSLASRVSHTDTILILVGEYALDDITSEPEFAVVDGIVYLINEPFGRFDQRWMRVVKFRGLPHLSGKHAYRLGPVGVEVFPRFEAVATTLTSGAAVENAAAPKPEGNRRMPFGIAGLDEMLEGGLPHASATLIAAPSGVGKTVLALHFIAEGIARGERCMFLSFQQTEERLIERAQTFGWDFAAAQESGLLDLRYLEPVEISLDVIGVQLLETARDHRVQRLVIDSLAEIEPAARGTGRFPDYLSALTGLCRSVGATSILTSETAAFFGPAFELPQGLAFVADNVIVLRYVELNSELRRVLGVMKMRDGRHDRRLVEVEINETGMKTTGPFSGLTGVLGGTPVPDQ